MFAPRWKKESKLLHKGARKFLNYKRDLLDADKIEAIEEARDTLRAAIKAGNRDEAAEAEKLVSKACEGALPVTDDRIQSRKTSKCFSLRSSSLLGFGPISSSRSVFQPDQCNPPLMGSLAIT